MALHQRPCPGLPTSIPGLQGEEMQRGKKQRGKMQRTLHQVASFPGPPGMPGMEITGLSPSRAFHPVQELSTHTRAGSGHDKSHKTLIYKPNTLATCCSPRQGSQSTGQTPALLPAWLRGSEDAAPVLTPARLTRVSLPVQRKANTDVSKRNTEVFSPALKFNILRRHIAKATASFGEMPRVAAPRCLSPHL